MKEYMPLIAAAIGGLIVSIGWFVTGKLNRANNVDLKRLDFRIKALESFLLVWNEIEKDGAALGKQDVIDKLAASRRSFQLYGTEADIGIMEEFVSAIEECNLTKANQVIKKLVAHMRSGIRQELRIDT